MAKPQFRKGMEVEVCSSDEALRGSWFPATIVRSHMKKKQQVSLEYKTLMADEAGSKPQREFVDVMYVRPTPPRDLHPVVFNSSDEVDAYHSGAWWEGVVVKVIENSRYLVHIRVSKEEIEFAHSDLRLHREWSTAGSWVPPYTQDIVKEINSMDGSSRAVSFVQTTACITYQSNAKKLEIVRPPPKSQESKISSPCKKIKKEGETGNNTSFLAYPEIAMPTTLNTNGKEAPLQKQNEISKKLSDVFSSPSDALTVNFASNSGQEKIVGVLDLDKSSNLPKLNDFSLSPLSNKNGEQVNSSEGQCLQKNMVIQPQLHCEKETTSAPTLNGEEELPLQKEEGSQISTDIFSNASEGLSSDLAPSFSQEEMGNVLDCNRSWSHPTVTDLSLLPLSSNEGEQCDHLAPNFSQVIVGSIVDSDQSENHSTTAGFCLSTRVNNGEQCDPFKAQVQCTQQSLLTQSTPYITTTPDPQQCRRVGTGWRCPEIVSPGKQHCEKHLLEQNIRNERRRNMPKEQFRIIMEPFIPSDQQRCRRTGKGWRCPVMASQGKRYCENHQLKQDIRNEKRRKRPLEQIQFHMEPFLPSEPHQCRRTGKGWRCSAITSSGKRYCDKHQSEQNIHNEKRRKRRKELVTIGNDERINSSGDHHLVLNQQQCSNVDFVAKCNQGDAVKTDKTLVQVSNPLDENAEHTQEIAVRSNETNSSRVDNITDINPKHYQDDARKSGHVQLSQVGKTFDTDSNCNQDPARKTDATRLPQDYKTVDIEAKCNQDDSRETDQAHLNHVVIIDIGNQTQERGTWNHPWMSFSDTTRIDQGLQPQDSNNVDMHGKDNKDDARKHPSQLDNDTASINMANDQMEKRGIWNHPWISFSQSDKKITD